MVYGEGAVEMVQVIPDGKFESVSSFEGVVVYVEAPPKKDEVFVSSMPDPRNED
jgi:hypothetical protein